MIRRIPGLGVKNWRRYGHIGADARRYIPLVDPYQFTQMRHFINERNFGRQERIGGILNHFGRLPGRHQDRGVIKG